MDIGTNARVVCIGGADVDRKFELSAPVVAGTRSLVGAARLGYGGVARNVAVSLIRLDVPAALVSLVGEDPDGDAVVRDLDRRGIDARGVARITGATTAQYVVVFDPAGGLVVEVADMAIFERFDPERLDGARAALATADWVFADANLRTDVLSALARRVFGGAYRLAVDAVSVPKAARLPQRLEGIDLLFLNQEEATAYLGVGGGAEAGALASALRARGADAVVMTLGARGALVDDGASVLLAPIAVPHVVDVTGAGDALIAATIARTLAGDALLDAVRTGIRAASLTIASADTVLRNLTPALVAP